MIGRFKAFELARAYGPRSCLGVRCGIQSMSSRVKAFELARACGTKTCMSDPMWDSGRGAEAPALFEKVDAYAATISDDVPLEQLVFVAQAVIMQRLCGDGDGRKPVRAELVTERAPIEISDEALQAVVQHELDKK